MGRGHNQSMSNFGTTNFGKIGTLKTGRLIEGGRLIQGCYIQVRLYIISQKRRENQQKNTEKCFPIHL